MKRKIMITLLMLMCVSQIHAQDEDGILKIEMTLNNLKSNKSKTYELNSVDYNIGRSFEDTEEAKADGADVMLSFTVDKGLDAFLTEWLAEGNREMSGEIIMKNIANKKVERRLTFKKGWLTQHSASYMKGANYGSGVYCTAILKDVQLDGIEIK